MKLTACIAMLLALAALFLGGCAPASLDTRKETHAVPGAEKKQALTAETT